MVKFAVSKFLRKKYKEITGMNLTKDQANQILAELEACKNRLSEILITSQNIKAA